MEPRQRFSDDVTYGVNFNRTLNGYTDEGKVRILGEGPQVFAGRGGLPLRSRWMYSGPLPRLPLLIYSY